MTCVRGPRRAGGNRHMGAGGAPGAGRGGAHLGAGWGARPPRAPRPAGPRAPSCAAKTEIRQRSKRVCLTYQSHHRSQAIDHRRYKITTNNLSHVKDRASRISPITRFTAG